MSGNVMRRVLGCVGIAATLLLSGCGSFFNGFFQSPTTGTTTTPGSTVGDYVYAVNEATNTLSGFAVGADTLTAVSGSPYGLVTSSTGTTFGALSVAVSRSNAFVFVGGNGAIECFSIGTGGVLTQASTGGISLETADFVSLATSPDGNWLFGLDQDLKEVYTFQINQSTCALTTGTALPLTLDGSNGVVTARSVTVSPNGDFAAVAFAYGGFAIMSFNTSTGALAETGYLGPPNGDFDNAVLFDSTSTHLLVATGGSTTGTSGVSVYTVSSSGAASQVGGTILTGDDPYALLEDPTNTYVYTADKVSSSSAGSVSGFAYTSSALTALTGSPYSAGGISTQAFTNDSSEKYVIAVSPGGSPDVTMFAYDVVTPGKLDAVARVASGTDPAGSVAVAATWP